MSDTTAVIFGVEGLRLSEQERAFFKDTQPWGFILFARNVADPAQLPALTDELRSAVGWHAPILIDQEGGRVQRLRAPLWRDYPPALDQMQTARDPLRAQWIRNRLIAAELFDAGIDVNCAPLADLVEDGTHPVLRNRLYGGDIDTVVDAARACSDAFLTGGVLPVLKHIPGYGRAQVDGHLSLPRVSAPKAELMARDFVPFAALSDIKMGMTAHIVMEAIDPARPATISPDVIDVIRRDIGFDGVLMTDDISMEALSGTIEARAAASIAAGCDIVLHCNGDMAEMQAVASVVGPMTAQAGLRATAALAQRRDPEPLDIAALETDLADLLR